MALALLLALTLAQGPGGPAAPAAECTCRADLDTLAAKLERNYVAWPIEYQGTAREAQFRSVHRRLQGRADRTRDEDCIFVLRELTDWFHDGHLFVFEYPTLTAERAATLARSTGVRPVDETRIRADLTRRGAKRDPIEGIWYAPGYRMAIVPDTAGPGGTFVGILLSSDSALWKPGHVKARFVRNRNAAYATVLLADDHSPRHMDARIYRNLLLATTPVTWGREWPLAPHEEGNLDPSDPGRPTARLLGSDAVVVSVPSHDPKYRAVLDSVVGRFREALSVRPYLLIDIRGDLGGGSQTTAPLVPYLVTAALRPPIGPQGSSTVISSPDNIRYFQRGWNPDSIAERMQAAPGVVLPLMRNETLDMPFPNQSVMANPSRVAVLMDRGVASAGEAFVLQARKSTRVTLYGDNTWGMIDYQSVSVVRLACRERGILFGYPMIAASATLPRDGLNRLGIPPDVRVGPAVRDVPGWVLEHLRRNPPPG